jgi:hypothetical protein
MAERLQDWRANRAPLVFFSKSGSTPRPEISSCSDDAINYMDLCLVNFNISVNDIDLGVVKPRICGPFVTAKFCRPEQLTPPTFP